MGDAMAEGASEADKRSMGEPVKLSQAAARFVASLSGEARKDSQAEVHRFARWFGADRPIGDLRGHDIDLYAQSLGPATADVLRRADVVRSFLSFAKKEGLTATNLASHLRLRKSPQSATTTVAPPPKRTQLTEEGHASLQEELKALKEQRPAVAEELRVARLDKDVRENAPLDAALDRQAHIEARIRELETLLKHAEVVGGGADSGSKAHLGSTLVVRDLASGGAMRYTLVSPSEVSPAQGKISVASPVGKALIERAVGDEVEVLVPAGILRFRIEEISG
jgi:transcription elongation factor GreA